ncbi:uncharacterized protein LOC107479484 [Arachis duranensis]|uniref:Uncharacterized protein LOC107479484 n=1 Tax=Arachis duranensis TaxID=130453 RepID=A0A6P4CVB2_ARADU|nr:uncharacterized protein LOC107479484 [Arachis duranensis]
MFNEWVQLHISYEGLSYESKKAVDHSSGGSLNKKKTVEEAIYVIETVAENDYFYASERSNTRGVMSLNHMDALLAQNKMITKQLADLTKQMERNQVVAVTTPPPAQEGVNTEKGGDWEQANYVRNSPWQSHDPYSKTYNPGWKNHPNFGWGNQEDQSQDQRCHNPNNNAAYQHFTQRLYQYLPNNTSQQPYQTQNDQSQHSNLNPPLPSEDRLSRLETLLEGICKEVQDSKVFREEVRSNMQNQDDAIKKLETHISYLFKQVPGHNICNNTNANPREECQDITLRSGKQLKETSKEPQEKNMDGGGKGQEEVQASTPNSHQKGEALKPYVPKAPYPQQLKKSGDESQFSRFLEVFKRLQINIPFAEAIEQMLLYAKFLKELLTKKRIWKNNGTVVLTEECSAIIQHKLPRN